MNQFEYEAGAAALTERGAPLENAHSIPFSLAAETGIFGLAAFLFFLGQLGRARGGGAARPRTSCATRWRSASPRRCSGSCCRG